jgi:hypothetical protein
MDLYRTEPRALPAITADVPFDASVTLYLRGGAPTAARDGQADARARVEALVEAGILLDVTVSEWPSKAVVPSDGPADSAVGIYDEFSATVATRPGVTLDPFFEDRAGVGRVERMVILPVICLAIRRRDDLTGLYPCWNDGRHDAVGDGLAALEVGEDVENLA